MKRLPIGGGSRWRWAKCSRPLRDWPDPMASFRSPQSNPLWSRYLRFWGRRAATELDDELLFHLEMRARDNLARGMSAAAARAEAIARIGDTTVVRDECLTIANRS